MVSPLHRRVKWILPLAAAIVLLYTFAFHITNHDMLPTKSTVESFKHVEKNTGNDQASTGQGALSQPKRASASTSAGSGTSSGEFVKKRFLDRNMHAREICSELTPKDLRPKRILNGIMDVFARGQYSWCQVPRVGTSFLKVLNKGILGPVPKDSNTHKKKSFFIVREPYSRLVSAYIGEIVTNQIWWEKIGRHVVKEFRFQATEREIDCGNNVTFPEFVKYFIRSQETGIRKNIHFVPLSELCNPCTKSYDYILHLETLKDDLRYLLEAVNIRGPFDHSDEKDTIADEAKSIVTQKKEVKRCEPMRTALRKFWWSLHARGFISRDIPFPLKEEKCNSISEDEFASIALNAHAKSVGHINKFQQKRDALVELFLQVPLSDRLKVKDMLAIDCKLFGYDPQPPDLFPELYPS